MSSTIVSTSSNWQLLILSSSTVEELDFATRNLLDYLKRNPSITLAQLAYSLQIKDQSLKHRRALVCQSIDDAITILETKDSRRILTSVAETRDSSVAFMFTGLGEQYINMGLGLYQSKSIFRQHFDQCAELLKAELNLDIREIVYPQGSNIVSADKKPKLDFRRMLGLSSPDDEATQKLNQTFITQPLMFAIEYSLAKLWIDCGIKPKSMMGYSIGEYVVACLSGVFTLEDGLKLIASRAKLMQTMPTGAMLAIPLSELEAISLLGDHLSIAAINGSNVTVVAGQTEAITELETKLLGEGLACRRLQTTHAFHSNMMSPLRDAVIEITKSIKRNIPQISYISTVTGKELLSSEALDDTYWAKHMCQPVRFANALAVLSKKNTILLEVGPGQTLSAMAMQNQDRETNKPIFSSLRSSYLQQEDLAFFLNTLAKLWLTGITIDWKKVSNEEQQIIEIPKAITKPDRESEIIKSILLKHEAIDDAVVLSNKNLDAPKIIAYVVAKEKYATSIGGHLRYLLPNNMAVAQINKNETDHLYQDIFTDLAYFKPGVLLPPNATIFDVGANIGMFTLFINQYFLNPTIYAFEPLPPIFEILTINSKLYGEKVKVFPIGLSDKETDAKFTFYPRYSVMSGLSDYANAQEDLSVVKTVLTNEKQHNSDELAMLVEHADEMFASRFEAKTYDCKLKTISSIIEQESVKEIDLLKIDVQRSELDVLNGISENDWSKIKQIIMEVHDAQGIGGSGRVSEIVSLLKNKGFKTIATQDELFTGTDHYNIYAYQEDYVEVLKQSSSIQELTPIKEFKTPFLDPSQLVNFLAQNTIEHLPSYITIIDQIPLTVQKDIDKETLLSTEFLASLELYPCTKKINTKDFSQIGKAFLPIWKQSLPFVCFNTEELTESIIFTDNSKLSNILENKLQKHASSLFIVKNSKQFSRLTDSSYTINAQEKGDFLKLLQNIPTDNKNLSIIYFTDFINTLSANLEINNVTYNSLKALNQTLLEANFNKVTVLVVSQQLHLVRGNEEFFPENTNILAICKYLSQNNKKILWRVIDIDDFNNPLFLDNLANNLIKELTFSNNGLLGGLDLAIAYRGKTRWIQSLEQIETIDLSLVKSLKKSNNYLFFGEPSIFELALAEYLIKTCEAKVAFIWPSTWPNKTQWSNYVSLPSATDSTKNVIRYLQHLNLSEKSLLLDTLDFDCPEQIPLLVEHVNKELGQIDVFCCFYSANNKTDYQKFVKQIQYFSLSLDSTNTCLAFSLTSTELKQPSFKNAFLTSFCRKSEWANLELFLALPIYDTLTNGSMQQFSKISQKDLNSLFASMLSLAKEVPRLIIQTGDLQQLKTEESEQVEFLEITSKLRPRPKLSNDYIPAKNLIEKDLVNFWEELLGIKPIGIYDTFFDLGGHSLLVFQLVNKIKISFEVDISIAAFFAAPTIADLASEIQKNKVTNKVTNNT